MNNHAHCTLCTVLMLEGVMEYKTNVVGGTLINLLAILGVKTWAKTNISVVHLQLNFNLTSAEMYKG